MNFHPTEPASRSLQPESHWGEAEAAAECGIVAANGLIYMGKLAANGLYIYIYWVNWLPMGLFMAW